MGVLYLVATPIGNLQDITLRAVAVLKQVSLVAAEDTRRTSLLLRHLGVSTKMVSYFEHSGSDKVERILGALEDGDVALVSEAGMPAISDPGYDLVVAAIERGFRIVPIPGASAPLAALAASGLPTNEYVFLGFLPRRHSDRVSKLLSVAAEDRTLVLFEAPHRLRASLQDMLSCLGNRRVCVARELTKLHEEFFRGTLAEACDRFGPEAPRGEITIVVEGCPRESMVLDDNDLQREVLKLLANGASVKEAAATVAQRLRVPRRKVYSLAQRLASDKGDSGPE